MVCFVLQKPSLNKMKGTQADIHMIEHRFSRLQGLWNEDRLNEKYLWTWFSEEPYFSVFQECFCLFLNIFELYTVFLRTGFFTVIPLWSEVSKQPLEFTCPRVSFWIKLQADACTIFEKKLWHRCCEFSEISKNTFFTERLRKTATV